MIQGPFADGMTLKEAQDVLRELLREGHKCPVCTQFAKTYRRKINSTMARTVITLLKTSRAYPDLFLHGPSLPGDTHEISQLSWWGLVEEERVRRPDGGRAGYWRLTDNGRAFAQALKYVSRYALVYDGRLLGFEGERVTIEDCLGSRFNYHELMRA